MILITGATGNVGQEVVAQLQTIEQAFRVLVRDPSKVAYLQNRAENRAEIVQGDLDKPETLAAAMQGVTRVFLLDGTPAHVANTIAAAQQTGVRHIVKLSTAEAIAHTTQIGQWHFAREQLLRESGLAWTFLQPGQFMSNTFIWADMIRQHGTVYAAASDSPVAPIDPADIAAVAVAALTQPGHEQQAYPLTGPAVLTPRQQVETLARLLGKPIHLVAITPADEIKHMTESGMPSFLVSALAELTALLLSGEGAYQTDTVQRITGRAARTFEDWSRAHLQAFQ